MYVPMLVFFFVTAGLLITAYPNQFAWVAFLVLASRLLTRR